MPLSGTLGTMPLPDLLQWLAASNKGGIITFNRGKILKKIFLMDGAIVGCSSTDPTDYIGQWLVSCGRITEDQLRIALGEQERSNTFLGTILVQMGAIPQEELSRVLALKSEEIVYGIFEWDDAAFEFDDSEFEPLPFPVAIRIEDVMLKGVHRFDETLRIRKVFPDSSVVLKKTESSPPPEIMQNPHARRILECIDGRQSIASISLHTHASEYIVSKFLLDLFRHGHIEPVVRPEESKTKIAEDGEAVEETFEEDPSEFALLGGPNERTFAKARALFEKGNFEGALALLSQGSTSDQTIQSLLRKTESKLVEKLYKVSLPPDMIPVPAKDLQDMTSESISAEESYLLSRMDGTWDIRSIVSISPLREVDALRVLNSLLGRGLVRVLTPDEAGVPVQA